MNETVRFEFNYASIVLIPYAGNKSSSNNLLKQLINKLNDTDFPNDSRILDRHKNHKNSAARNLVMISNHFTEKGTRCIGRIALIKNKNPIVWKGKDVIEEIKKEANQKFIDITNYIIHFSSIKDEAIIMHEFNSEGPRLSDIEYFLRQIATKFQIAKSVYLTLHLDTQFDDLAKNMTNIFGVTVKVKSSYSNQHLWLTSLKQLNDDSGFRDVRLEFYYKREKEPNGKYKKNVKGLDMSRNLLGWLKKDSRNIDYVEDLKMTYQASDDEKILDFDLLKNKTTSIIDIPLTEGKIYKSDDYKTLVIKEFNYYLNTGNTTQPQF
jgi:hypothetical protein